MPVASPAVFEKIGTRFRQAVARFAEMNDIPVVKFTKGTRKIDVMGPLLARAAEAGRPRVVAIGWAREFQRGRAATRRVAAQQRAVATGPEVTTLDGSGGS